MSINILESPSMTSGLDKHVIRMSKRLVDSLGLVYGDIVKIGDTKRLRVEPSYTGDESSFGDMFAFVSSNCAANIVDSPPHKITPLSSNQITIGCDPEFILVTKAGAVVNCNNIFPKTGMLGSDAGLGELRPYPSNNSLDVVESLRNLINRIPSVTKYIPISTSYYKNWVTGFHVHIGLPKALLTCAAEKSVEFIRNVIQVMDYYIGIPAMLTDPSDSRRLSEGDYGKPGDFRIGARTVEYRTPGGFHLRTPKLAHNLLESSYVLLEDILGRATLLTKQWTRMEEFYSEDHFRELYHVPESEVTKRILVDRSRDSAREQLPRVHELFTALYGYERSSGVIDSFLSAQEPSSPLLLNNWLK